MTTIGERIAEKLVRQKYSIPCHISPSGWTASLVDEYQQLAAIIDAEIALLVEALREIRGAISDFKGHGMPGFTNRAEAYLILQKVDSLLAKHPVFALAGQEPEEPKDL